MYIKFLFTYCACVLSKHSYDKYFDTGRASCTLNISSSLFSDPCPGNSKYLHVEYTCEGLLPFFITNVKFDLYLLCCLFMHYNYSNIHENIPSTILMKF